MGLSRVCTQTRTPLRAKNQKQKGEIDVKKIISIALALLMVAVMLPVMAMADDSIYTITLSDNTTQSITVKNGATCTLNLNGKTLTNEAGKDTIYVEMGGTLIINGTGTVDNVSHGRAAIFNNGTVTLNGGTYTRSAEVGTGKDPDSNHGNSWYTICNHGVMTVNAGVTVTNTGTFSSVFENGYQSYTGNNERSNYVQGTNNAAPKLTINGGTFEGGKITIKNDDGGILEINNGRFTNRGNRVVFNANKAEINGGEFNCPTTYFNNGIAVDTAYFVGGENAGTLEISGGAFNGRITKNEDSDVGVTGGTFNTDVTPYVGQDTLAVTDGSNYYVGGTARDAVQNATGGTFTIKKAERGTGFNNVKPGVTIVNNSGTNITVNGNEVNLDDTYTVPGAPIIIYTPDNEPAILSGANQVVAPGSAATFRIDEEYDRLLAVAVDGVTLDKSNYEAWSGSTYIKLLPKFMKTLSVGTHTLTAYFTSHTVSTTFTISGGAKNPATGANDFVGVAAAMAVVSLLGAAAVIRKK